MSPVSLSAESDVNHEEVVEKLKEGYTTFQRPHMNDNFQHYSAEQKDLLRKTIIELKMAVERKDSSFLTSI